MATLTKFCLLRSGAVCAALCLGLAVQAQTTGAGTGTGTGTATGTGTGTGTGMATGGAPAAANRAQGARDELPRTDVAFMKQAAENNHAEIESSKLALTKATDPQVKAFAQKMIDDHGKTGQELAALASAKGVELPDGPSLIQKGKLKLLSMADGADFDRRYSETMGHEAHRETIELFRKAANEVSDPEVKAFASKTLPALQQHLEMAGKLPADKNAGNAAAAKR